MAININQRLNGLHSLSYMGDNAVQPPDFVTKQRPPTTNDSKNFALGDIWLDTTGYPGTVPTAEDVYMLVSLIGNQATWVNFAGGNALETLTGNSGGAVSGDANDNLNILGTGVISVVGTPLNNTLTITPSGAIASSFPTDFTSPATPALGVLNVLGGTSTDPEQIALVYRKNVHTAAVTDTVFVKLNESLSFPATNAAGTAGVIYSGGVAAANRFISSFGQNNVFVGHGSGNFTVDFATSPGNTGMGAFSLTSLGTTSTYNSAVGYQALNALSNGGGGNCAVGMNSQVLNQSGDQNCSLGQFSLEKLTTGSNNLAIGTSSGSALTTESNNTLINHAGVAGLSNSVIMSIPGGSHYFFWDGSDELYVGVGSGNTATTAVNNVVFGSGSLPLVTTASDNVLVGNHIMTTATNAGTSNLVVGSAGYNVGKGSLNTLVGSLSLGFATTASNNVALGHSTGYNSGASTGLLTGSSNIMIGYAAGNALVGAESNCVLINAPGVAGYNGLNNIGNVYSDYGAGNTFVGSNVGNFTLTVASAKYNTAIGDGCLPVITTGQANTATGYVSLNVLSTASNNSAYGMECLGAITTGGNNTAVGYTCGFNSVAGGITTGTNNCLFGAGAGSNYRGAESGNIIIGTSMPGVLGESNKTKIGGIRGATTTNADAIAVLIDSAGQLGTISSSARYKDNIESMGSYSDVLRKLRPVTFNYKSHSPESISVGLIAEEVDEVAPQLVVYNKDGECETVRYHDLVPMLLNELQKVQQNLLNNNLLLSELVRRVEILESKK